MAIIDDIPETSDSDLDRYADIYWERGTHPAHRRVWSNGRDVTDEDPATWPAIWNPNLPTPQSGRYRAVRSRA